MYARAIYMCNVAFFSYHFYAFKNRDPTKKSFYFPYPKVRLLFKRKHNLILCVKVFLLYLMLNSTHCITIIGLAINVCTFYANKI